MYVPWIDHDYSYMILTSNPEYIPTVDIVQGHSCKPLEILIKVVDCGWSLTVNAVICPANEGPLVC